ncbi:KTSC domain-containing protein [Candidatus Pantoea rara]|jgi:hypothetical protein|uniref:KTSC domain-containing protein n=2 Tax=Pantoea TaxID=53335 RepID=UPI003EB92C2A
MPLNFTLYRHSLRVPRAFTIKYPLHLGPIRKNTMNRHKVTSTLFTSAGYDATTGVLELEYRNGGRRRWLAVPAKVYQAFCAAADSDTFFRTRINGHYLSDAR